MSAQLRARGQVARSHPSIAVSRPSRARAHLRCRASLETLTPVDHSSTSAAPSTSPAPIDIYVLAGRRLKALLSGVGDGNEELLQQLVAEESPEGKLQTAVVFGGALTLGAVIVSSLLQRDPWGGASLSVESLQAAAVGAMAAVPMVAFRAWSWGPSARKALPSLEDMHHSQLEAQRPWLTQMSQQQVLMMMALEVLPMSLLLFPAAQNGIVAGLSMYSPALTSLGLANSSEQLGLVALVVVAALSSVGRSVDLSVSDEEFELVTTSAVNADRYYRTMAAANTHTPEEAGRAADAFRLVAQAWVQTKEAASTTAGVLGLVDVLLLGSLWHWTGDLTSTAVAALAINYVDVHYLHEAVLRKEGKAGPGGPGAGPGGPSKGPLVPW